MILNLLPALESLAPETRAALFEQANREGLPVGELVKRWIQRSLALDELESAMSETESLVGLSLDDITGAGLRAIRAPESRLGTLLRRIAEIEAALEIRPGHGIAEAFLGDLLDQIAAGDFDMILSGWEFEGGPEWASRKLAALTANWKEAA